MLSVVDEMPSRIGQVNKELLRIGIVVPETLGRSLDLLPKSSFLGCFLTCTKNIRVALARITCQLNSLGSRKPRRAGASSSCQLQVAFLVVPSSPKLPGQPLFIHTQHSSGTSRIAASKSFPLLLQRLTSFSVSRSAHTNMHAVF